MVAKLINLLAFITLFEMMITIGLRVTVGEVTAVARNVRLVTVALIATYILVPGVTLALLQTLGAALIAVALGRITLHGARAVGHPIDVPFTTERPAWTMPTTS